MTTQEKIGLKIHTIKKEKRLTQFKLAKLVGLSENCIGKIERGQANPTIETLDRLARELKIPLENLLSFEEGLNETEQAIKELTNYLETRDTEDIKFLHGLAVKILEKGNHSERIEKFIKIAELVFGLKYPLRIL